MRPDGLFFQKIKNKGVIQNQFVRIFPEMAEICQYLIPDHEYDSAFMNKNLLLLHFY